METLFDWSDIPESHDAAHHRNQDGTVDWRKRCLHLAYAADALQLAAINATPATGYSGPPGQIQEAGDLVYFHLEWLRADYAGEQDGWSGDSCPVEAEVERLKPALMRMLAGIRSDDRLTTIVQALADAIHDSAAEVGEDSSQESRELRAVCRRWSASRE
jgi:hypothetical protein